MIGGRERDHRRHRADSERPAAAAGMAGTSRRPLLCAVGGSVANVEVVADCVQALPSGCERV